jgi:hypothetical protein
VATWAAQNNMTHNEPEPKPLPVIICAINHMSAELTQACTNTDELN